MIAKRVQWVCAALTLVLGAVVLYAQNPISIAQVGTTAVTTTVPVSGTVTANQGGAPWAENITQLGGTAIDTNSGNKSAGTQRVVLATDQPNLTSALNVALAANQSVNVAQINGVTPLMGSGNTGTGSHRVTIATDQAALAGMGVGATGAAPPANANYLGGVTSGATAGLLGGITVCDSRATISLTANTQIITGTASRHVYICSINLVVAAATNVAIVSGTGSTCGTGTGAMAGGTTAATGWNLAANGGIAQGTGLGWIMRTGATGDNVCILVSAANQTSGVVTYAVY